MSATAGDIAFTKLGGVMAIAVEGLDLHHAPDAELAKTLRRALLANLVLCIRGQSIGPGAYLATIATFGEPLVRPEIPHVSGYPAVTTLSSDDRDTKGDGKRLIAGSHWHSDDTFMAKPCSLTCLYGIEVHEMLPYRSLPEHIEEQLRHGRTVLVEMDAWYLPDTAATSYRAEHLKTTIVPEAIDRGAERLRYLHNAGLYELSGEDYRGCFRMLPHFTDDVMDPFTELVRWGEPWDVEDDDLLESAA